jgi:3-dehydroquinate dehydratase-2
MLNIWVLNGPNLNALGFRETQWYGHQTLSDLEQDLKNYAKTLDCSLECRQTNHEGVMMDWLYEAKASGCKAMIVNLGAWTHTSLALRDALAAVAIPFIEVHLSNIYAREDFRHHSLMSSLALGSICGLGVTGYRLALQYLKSSYGVGS